MTNSNKLFQIFTELQQGFYYGPVTSTSHLDDQAHCDKYCLIIEKHIKQNSTTKLEFNEQAKKFAGLDLLYSDYLV